jgi:hypothetical protein
MSRHVHSVSKIVNLKEERKILDRLNSLNSAEEMTSVISANAGHKVLYKRIAQRILNEKAVLGRFQHLQQVAIVPGVGKRRFNIIIYALKGHT